MSIITDTWLNAVARPRVVVSRRPYSHLGCGYAVCNRMTANWRGPRAQVMHSDIKARNVLLSANRDVAKISDVGVAKFLNEMATQTQSAYVAWTFAYAAPEILMNQKSGAQVPKP